MTDEENLPYRVRLPSTWEHRNNRGIIPWLAEFIGENNRDWVLVAEFNKHNSDDIYYIFKFKDQTKATAFRVFWG